VWAKGTTSTPQDGEQRFLQVVKPEVGQQNSQVDYGTLYIWWHHQTQIP